MPTDTDTDTQGSAFVITELTGDKRVLRLSGRALPYKPYSLSGSQRNSIDWYPGNPIGVLQIYGAKEEETTINGWWKDMFLGEAVGHAPYVDLDGDQLGTAEDLAIVVDDIRRKGQEIRVQWFSTTRFGVLQRFTQKWHTTHDLEYEIVFAWTRLDEASLPKLPLAGTFAAASDLADAPQTFTAIANQFDDASASFTNGFAPGAQQVVDDTDLMSADLADQIDELADAIVQVVAAATAPGETQSRISGIFDGIKLTGADLRDQYEDQMDGARLDIGGTFGLVLADRFVVFDQANLANIAAVTAAQQQRKLLANAQSNNLRIFVARQGDDLMMVSQTFYNTPDDWRGLMLYNNLSDDTLSAGQIVLVPVTPPQEPSS